jgi:addiction module HigA family antidote
MPASTLRHPEIAPSHPGELLSEVVIPATGKSKVEIARLLGISRQSLYEILRQRQGVTPAIAVRLGKLFGNGPALWLNMQQAYDLWHAEQLLKSALETIPTLEAA